MPHKIEFDDPLEDFSSPSALNGTVVEEEHIWQILDVASANDDLQTVLDVVQRKNLRPRVISPPVLLWPLRRATIGSWPHCLMPA